MRQTLVSLAAFFALAVPALAEPMAARPQPTPQAVAPVNVQPSAKTGPVESAQSRSDKLFRRSGELSAAAMRSICIGCEAASAPKPVSHKPARVRPTTTDETSTEEQ